MLPSVMNMLLMVLGLALINACNAFTSEDCADFLAGHEELLNAIGMNIAANPNIFWTLHQLDFYGVITSNPPSVSLRYQHEEIRSIPINLLQISRLIIFGLQLSGNESILNWLGHPAAWLFCQDHTYNGCEPFDVCCIYDEQTSRKRKREPSQKDDDSERDKKIHLMDKIESAFSLPMDCD